MRTRSPMFLGNLMEYQSQNRWFVVIMILVMGVIMGRLFQLQVLGGKKYEKLAEINQVRRTRIPPRRGEVLDRKGRPLALNIDLYRAVIVPHYVTDVDAVLQRLSMLLLLTNEEVEAIKTRYEDYKDDKKKQFREIVVKRYINGASCPKDGTLLVETTPTSYAWCKTCGEQFIELPAGQSQCPFDGTDLKPAPDNSGMTTCPRCNRQFVQGHECPHDHTPLIPTEHNLRCPRCQTDYSDTSAVVMAQLHEMDGVFLREETVRAYPHGDLFAHVVGYVNEVNREELTTHPDVYRPGDYTGRRGIEKTMEDVLRGKAGEEVTFRDRRGRNMKLLEEEPTLANLKYDPAVPGNNVVLTLDVEVQRILQDATRTQHSVGIVVIDVDNGEVLGMYSSPSFDPNDWAGRLTAKRKKEYDDNPFYPMINKAATAFPPASTFKIVTALAALNEGIITVDTKINCPGHYDYSGHRFGCYNRYGHGDLELERALAVSCDVFFYRLGEWLGMDRLEQYSKVLGLGRRTGIEIGEDAGLVPSREWHERQSKGGFQPGFTLSTAVGQKDIRATPLQMALVLSQMVNGGHNIHPFLVDSIQDEEGRVVRSLRKEPGESLGFPDRYLKIIDQALVDVVESEEGTAHNTRLESIRFGAKTGTAEAHQVKKGVDPYVARWLAEDHAWTIAFAPAKKPRIAVAAIVEHGGYGGSIAGPIVSKVIYKLFSAGLVPNIEENEIWSPASEREDSTGILP